MISLKEILLAAIQGLAEWWPISSSAVVTFTSLKLGYSIERSLDYSLALHLGSGLAILLVFRKDIAMFFTHSNDWRIFSRRHYVYSLVLSHLVALPLHLFFKETGRHYGLIALLLVGIGLLITSFVLKKQTGRRVSVSKYDLLVTGFLQGISVLPGFSRKGLTTGYLIFRNHKPEIAVKTSFLLGAPALIVAGIYGSYMLVKESSLSLSSLIVLQTIVFTLSLASAKSFLKYSEMVNIKLFTLTLAILIILSVLLESLS